MSAIARIALEVRVEGEAHTWLTLAHLKALVHLAESAGMPDSAWVLNRERQSQTALILRDDA